MLGKLFFNNKRYWEKRYSSGGNSGDGSFGELANFKAEILNNFVKEHNIKSIIELGCGDGNQLKLAKYPQYLGLDISSTAVSLCRKTFQNDSSKSFELMKEYKNEKAELSLSIDVIFHLGNDKDYAEYMQRLFDSAEKFVIIYSSNFIKESPSPHIKYRKFTEWIDQNKNQWHLKEFIPNKYPFKGDIKTGSISDFYIYEINSKSK